MTTAELERPFAAFEGARPEKQCEHSHSRAPADQASY